MAVVAAAALCRAAWAVVPRRLTGPTEVLGYPFFANFAYQPSFWAYRLVLYAFPLLAILLYALVAWRGPLRRLSPRPGRSPDRLGDAVHPNGGAAATLDLPRAEDATRSGATGSGATGSGATGSGADRPSSPGSRVTDALSVPLRLAVPATVIIMAVAARTGHVRGVPVAAAAALIAVVLATAWAIRSLARRAGPGWGLRDTTGAPINFRTALALANGAGGAAATLLGLWYVSRHTMVFVGATTRHLPWFPLWLAGLAGLAVLGWTLHQLRRGRDARWIERVLLVTVVGSIGLFFAMSRLPGPVGLLQGYDDAMEKVGAALLAKGYFPWRDFLFIHGLFYDGLRGSVGMAVFGNTFWGINAGESVLILPLAWVFLYLFGAWISRGNPWFLVLTVIAAKSGYLPGLETRFIAVPLTLILLGATLRRRSRRWTAALIVALFVQAVLVPETGLLVIPALVVVVAADLVDRAPGTGLWHALRRTRWSVITGAVITGLFAAVLAAYGALKGFITYYLIFAPSHNEEGARPPFGFSSDRYFVFWGIGGVAVLITVWAAVWRIRRRAAWRPEDWMVVAAAGFVALYGEKALGRFDTWHIAQVFTVAMPLLMYWLWRGLRSVDEMARHAARVLAAPARTSGTIPAAGGTIPAAGGTIPAARGTIPADRGTVPTPAGRGVPARRGYRFVALGSPPTVMLLVLSILVFSGTLSATAHKIGYRHRLGAATDTLFPRLGYSTGHAVNVQQLNDLATAIRTYGGNGPVFDMTNSLGYVYYLMNLTPATRFVHVSLAMTPHAQRLLIDELDRARPPVVIFDSANLGLSAWDGITNNIRHYLVSEYILRGWTPVVRVDGTLLLVRRDLVSSGLPTPALAGPVRTTDLWFSGPTCDWGDITNFMRPAPRGPSVTLPVQPIGGYVRLTLTGWAVNPVTGLPANTIVIVDSGKVVDTLSPSVRRPDVARRLGDRAAVSGFVYSGVFPAGTRLSVYLRSPGGPLYRLHGTPGDDTGELQLADGSRVPVAGTSDGRVEAVRSVPARVGRADLPAGVNLTSYPLLTAATSGRPLAAGSMTITDQPGPALHQISADVLPGTATSVAIRAGACLQWYGYHSPGALYVIQDAGAPPVTTMTLSGVSG